MNHNLTALAKTLAVPAALYTPKAYKLGRDRALRKYGDKASPRGDADNANVEIPLSFVCA